MDEKHRGDRLQEMIRELSDDSLAQKLVSENKLDKDLAAQELYRRYHNVVLAIVRRNGVEDHRAEEIAQEIMLEAIQKIENYRTGSSFSAWLKSIARSRAVDAQRSEHGRYTRRKKVDYDGMEEHEKDRILHDHREGAHEELEGNERHDQLLRAVETLPENLRSVVQLTLAGKNLKEVGLVMGFTESRACQLLIEAKKKLQIRLDESKRPQTQPERRRRKVATKPGAPVEPPSDILNELIAHIDNQISIFTQERIAAEKRVADILRKLGEEK